MPTPYRKTEPKPTSVKRVYNALKHMRPDPLCAMPISYSRIAIVS